MCYYTRIALVTVYSYLSLLSVVAVVSTIEVIIVHHPYSQCLLVYSEASDGMYAINEYIVNSFANTGQPPANRALRERRLLFNVATIQADEVLLRRGVDDLSESSFLRPLQVVLLVTI